HRVDGALERVVGAAGAVGQGDPEGLVVIVAAHVASGHVTAPLWGKGALHRGRRKRTGTMALPPRQRQRRKERVLATPQAGGSLLRVRDTAVMMPSPNTTTTPTPIHCGASP